MFLQQAPSYGAAAQGLAASYSINLNTDLNHTIPLTSSWQGDPVKAKTLYVNNYANNFDITITNGGFTSIVPSLSIGYIDISSFDSIVISSTVTGTVPMAVYNFVVPPGFESRGVSPETVSTVPFTNNGSRNLTSSNIANDMCYVPDNGNIYVGVGANKLIRISDTNQQIVKVIATPFIPSRMAYGDGKIGIGYSNGSFSVFDVTSEAFVTIALTGAGAVKGVAYDTFNDRFVVTTNVDTFTVSLAGAIVSASGAGFLFDAGTVACDGLGFAYIYNTASSIIRKVTVSTLAIGANVVPGGTGREIIYIGNNRLFAALDTGNLAEINTSAMTSVASAVGVNLNKITYNEFDSCIWVSEIATANTRVYDINLGGLVATVVHPNTTRALAVGGISHFTYNAVVTTGIVYYDNP